MNNKIKSVVIAIGLFSITNLIAYALYFLFKHYIPDMHFKPNQKELGAAIASYSGTFLAILIAAFTFIFALNTKQIRMFKKYDYFNGLITLYGLTFFELGATFFAGVLCFSTIDLVRINSIAIGLAIATFLQLLILMLQLINLSSN